jgi:hypothetical protein
MANENAERRVQDTVIGVEFRDRRATAGGVSLAENLLEVSVQQFINPVRYRISPAITYRASRSLMALAGGKRFKLRVEFQPA